MTLLLFILLALLACLAYSTGRRRVAKIVASVTMFLLLLAGCGPLPHWLLSIVQSPQTSASVPLLWSESPAIVVIGAGLADAPGHDTPTLPVWSSGRLLRAAELYVLCTDTQGQCKVFLSGGGPGRTGAITEADLMAEQLIRLGVAPQDLILERLSQNTWQNAEFTAMLLVEHGIKGRPFLLTSAIHSRRADAYFNAAGIEVRTISTDFLSVEFTWLPNALNMAIADLALHEVVGMARLKVYSALGLNN